MSTSNRKTQTIKTKNKHIEIARTAAQNKIQNIQPYYSQHNIMIRLIHMRKPHIYMHIITTHSTHIKHEQINHATNKQHQRTT